MTTSTSIKILSKPLHVAFAVMAIAVFSGGAHAAEPDQITVQGSTEKTVGREYATDAPIQETTVKVAVSYDPATLATQSGAALLKESVADAARKACNVADPLAEDDGTCVREAIDSAQAQIVRLMSQAKSNTNG
jgi:UrcA family protein